MPRSPNIGSSQSVWPERKNKAFRAENNFQGGNHKPHGRRHNNAGAIGPAFFHGATAPVGPAEPEKRLHPAAGLTVDRSMG